MSAPPKLNKNVAVRFAARAGAIRRAREEQAARGSSDAVPTRFRRSFATVMALCFSTKINIFFSFAIDR
jgi:hypothetical protein